MVIRFVYLFFLSLQVECIKEEARRIAELSEGRFVELASSTQHKDLTSETVDRLIFASHSSNLINRCVHFSVLNMMLKR